MCCKDGLVVVVPTTVAVLELRSIGDGFEQPWRKEEKEKGGRR